MSEQESWTHEHAVVNGIRIHYVRQGEGPLVLLLHGFPENWYSWRFQIPVLAEHFCVVAPDLRGYNETEAPQDLESYRIEHLMDDAVGLVRHLGHERAAVVAHDWGGVIAYQLAAERPDLVEKLAVLNAPHPRKYFQAIRKSPRQLGRSWYVFFFQLPRVPEFIMSLGDFAFLRRSIRGMAVNRDAFPPEVLERFVGPMRRPGALTAGINYYRANLRHREALGKARAFPILDMPVRVIWGEVDAALDITLIRDMDDLFRGPFDVCTIPDCGHWVQQEEPGLVNRYLLEFLGSEDIPL